jgi:hypothetical protein
MKKLVYLLILFSFSVNAQEKNTGPKEKPVSTELSIKKQQRREARARRKREKEEKRAIKKHHDRLQTKKVRKRMKESRNTAIRNNENKREPFYRRWFRKKHRSR